jgi:hypothetical protein
MLIFETSSQVAMYTGFPKCLKYVALMLPEIVLTVGTDAVESAKKDLKE